MISMHEFSAFNSSSVDSNEFLAAAVRISVQQHNLFSFHEDYNMMIQNTYN